MFLSICVTPQIWTNLVGRDNIDESAVLMIQKRAMRAVTGLEPRDSCREAFRELNIITVIALDILETVNLKTVLTQ